TFLHRITPGAMGKSYGIHVARLAGLPEHVVSRARELLRNRDTEDTQATRRRDTHDHDEDAERSPNDSVLMPPKGLPHPSVLADLSAFALARMTPLEAIVALGRLQDRAHEMMADDEPETLNAPWWKANE